MDRLALLARAAIDVELHQLDAAEAAYAALLVADANDVEALGNLAAVFNTAERHPDAEAACRAALQLRPGYWPALSNLGVALHRQQRHGEAVASYIEALRANNHDVSACTNLGVALNEQWRMGESLMAHHAAVALAPENAVVRANRAMALLIAGDVAAGFTEFEWRWKCPGVAAHGFSAPQWDGGDPAGRVILVHDEGGFGDTLQFVRYVPMLVARGAKVILQVQAPLLRLMRQSFPAIAQFIVARGDWPPPHDLHCPMISLPRCFATTLDTIPGQTPYLTPDLALVHRWGERLRHEVGQGPRIGLVWAGSPRPGMAMVHAMDKRRSLALAQLAPLAQIAGMRFVSLQLGGDLSRVPVGLQLFDPMREMADFADTAALVANLDLVISVDTAVAHLAGALGRPVWVLSRYDACWRWLAGREDSPWYPGMRVFRQTSPGNWDSVLAAVVERIRNAGVGG